MATPFMKNQKTKSRPGSVKVASVLDLSGLKCPLPVLKAEKALRTLPPGTIIEIISTDPLSSIDIPHFCQENGHELVWQGKKGERLLFWLKKAKHP